MAIKNGVDLKKYFETGNRPTESNFEDLIDSSINKEDAGITVQNKNIGIGTNNPQSKLDVEGGVAIGAAYSGTYAAPSNGLLVEGNVGIGTTNPSAKLEVAGNTSLGGSLDVTGDTSVSTLDSTGATSLATDGGAVDIASSGALTTVKGTLNVDEAVTLDTTLDVTGATTLSDTLTVTGAGDHSFAGNVGIGTTSPKSKLDVEGGVAIGATYSGTNAAPTNGLLVEGNVGIGTDDPSAKLEVNGDINFTGKLKQDGIGVLTQTGSDIYANIRVIRNDGTGDNDDGMWIGYDNGGGAQGHLRFFANGTNQRMIIRADNGNVGIGTTNPSGTLHVVKGTNDTAKFTGSERTSHFHYSSAEDTYIRGGKTTSNVYINDGGDGYVRIGGKIYLTDLYDIGDHRNVQFNSSTKQLGYDNSSRRYKENIKQLSDDFSKILEVEPKTYTRPNIPNRWELGYIAEEFDDLGLNKLVYYDEEGRPDSINYIKMILYVLEVVKELKNGMKILEVNSEALTKKVATLAKKVK